MKMTLDAMKMTIAMAAVPIVLITATTAAATTLDFSYTSPNGSAGSASWSQPSNPVPVGSFAGRYTTIDVTDGTEEGYGIYAGQTDSFAAVQFYNASFVDGGFQDAGFISIGDTGLPLRMGVQIYSGDEANPVFSTGTFKLGEGTLTVTAASGAPEPGSWSLMLIGVAIAGGLARARGGRSLA